MSAGSSTMMTRKRITKEISDIGKEDLGGITLTPSDDDIFLWKGSIPGPEGSCYESGIFELEVQLPVDYPFSAPKVSFKTRIYHMNISERGHICIDILKHNWSPALSIYKVMLSLSSLLTDPNPQDPLVPSIATEFVRNRQQHDRTARQWTELYARPKQPESEKANGKKTAINHITDTSSVGSSSVAAETITIEGSDGESTGPSRTLLARATTHKRKRGLTATEDESPGSQNRDGTRQSRTKRRALATEPTEHAGASASGTSRTRNTRSRPQGDRLQAEDIIVIED